MKRPHNTRPILIICFTAVIVAVFYMSIVTVTTRIRPYVLVHTVLDAKSVSDGTYSAFTRKSGGIYSLKNVLLPLGKKVFSSVSGNFNADIESPTILDENTVIPSPSDTEIIERTINPSGGKQTLNEKISINNETQYQLDLSYLFDGEKPFETDGSPQILIVHSHTTESYVPTANISYSFTSEDRCTDTNYNMVRIGKEVAAELEKRGISTIHITDLYDYPKYNDSYARSCEGIEKMLQKYPSVKIVLDLHRDAINTADGKKTKITSTINGEKVAQVMVVVGTDELGLKHDNWEINLKYAIRLQKEFLKIGETFARPINLRTSRFNGHVAPGAVIIEVGAAGNTIEEALASCKYIAEAVSKSI